MSIDPFVPFDGADLSTSPNDPLWFFHHSNIERIFQDWTMSTGEGEATEDDPCGGYGDDALEYHGLHEPFYPPFDVNGDCQDDTPYDVCAEFYGDHPYTYDEFPSESSSNNTNSTRF